MVNRLDVHTFIYFELAGSSIVLVRYRPQFSRQAYSFLEVNQRRLRRNTWECKYDTREKNLSAVLANSSNHCRARRHNNYVMQVNITFTVNVIFCPSKANSWRL